MNGNYSHRIRRAWFSGGGQLSPCILRNPTPSSDELQLLRRIRPHLRNFSADEAGLLYLQERISKIKAVIHGDKKNKGRGGLIKRCSSLIRDLEKSRRKPLRSFPDPLSDDAGIVYLLHSPSHRAWKIGKSSGVDPTRRLIQIREGSSAEDAELICFIQLVSERNARRLEHSLHQRYAADRYDGIKGDGSSEWFRCADLPGHFAEMIRRQQAARA